MHHTYQVVYTSIQTFRWQFMVLHKPFPIDALSVILPVPFWIACTTRHGNLCQ